MLDLLEHCRSSSEQTAGSTPTLGTDSTASQLEVDSCICWPKGCPTAVADRTMVEVRRPIVEARRPIDEARRPIDKARRPIESCRPMVDLDLFDPTPLALCRPTSTTPPPHTMASSLLFCHSSSLRCISLVHLS